MVIGLATAILAALLQGGASTAQAVGADRAAARGRPALLHPLYLVGLIADLAGWGASLVALQTLPLLAVEPIMATSLVVTVLLNIRALRVRPTRFGVRAMVVIVAAVALVAIAAEPAHGQVGGGPFVTAMIVATVLVVLACAAVYLQRRPVVAAVVGGLGYGVAAVAGRGLDGGSLGEILAHPLTWVLLASATAGTAAFAHGLELAGPEGATRVTAWLWVVEVLVPAVVGVLALGDTVRPGWWPVAALALPTALVATVAISSPRAVRDENGPARRVPDGPVIGGSQTPGY